MNIWEAKPISAFDSSDLLARFKFLTNRPATDESVSDVQIYSLLTEAQAQWTNTIASLVPFILMGPPTTLVSTDGNLTYPFPGGIFPLAVEIYDSLAATRPLRPCTYWDTSGDYLWEGDHIRFPQGRTSTLSQAPVARYILPPDVLDANHPPTLVPPHACLLIVYRAAALWAARGGMRDPKPYYDMEHGYWFGSPETGDVGLLGALRTANPFLGGIAVQQGSGGILEGVSTGQGYRALPP